MLKLSGIIKTTPFEFTDLDGSVHKLQLSEFTIGDIKKLIDIQGDLGSDDSEMTIGERSEIIILSRVICGVKLRGKQKYFWQTIDELRDKNYPNDLLTTLYAAINELNPLKEEKLNEKKS
jgi:hypothetical protein